MRSAGLYLALVTLLLSSANASALAKDKLPVPGNVEQAEAKKKVEQEYSEDVDSAKTPADQLKLVERLFSEARNSADQPARRYAILGLAFQVAPDMKSTMNVVDAVAKTFDIDAFKMQSAAVWRVSKKAKLKDEHADVAAAAHKLILKALVNDDYDSAKKLATIAVSASKRSKDRATMKQMRAIDKEVQKLQVQYGKVKKALDQLEQAPSDPDANLIVGKYHCFVKDDWKQGLPMLAVGSSTEFQALAEREQQEPDSSEDQMQLADDWFELVKKTPSHKTQMMARAAHWYGESLQSQPALSDKAKARAEKRMAVISGSGSRMGARKKPKRNDFLSAVLRIKAYKLKMEESLGRPELDTVDKKKAYAAQHRQEWFRNIKQLVDQANKYKTVTMKFRIKLFQVAPGTNKAGRYRILFGNNEVDFMRNGFYIDLTPAQAN
ncbi:MAG: hypothetical protein N2C12_00975, partial [Planctomycetales bacterium]